MTPEQLSSVLELGREQPAVEFKSPGPRTDRHLFAKVVRAMLGMANRRDGGTVIVGVDETNGGVVASGVPDVDRASWRYDDIADGVAQYADPSIDFHVDYVSFQDKVFVVVTVREFSEVPILCKRDYNRDGETILRVGACYVRPRRKPETVEVSSYPDMRDLLDLATEKSLRRFVAMSHRGGVSVASAYETDAANFANEIEDHRRALPPEVTTRGYWTIVVRPTTFEPRRIEPLTTLCSLASELAVEHRGWQFPYVGNVNEVELGVNWVGRGVEFSQHREYWRLYQSGLFIFVGSILDDWTDESIWGEPPSGWDVGKILSVADALCRYVETFDFASRLALSDVSGAEVYIEVTVTNLMERQLDFRFPNRTSLITPRIARLQEFPYIVTLDREDLLTNGRDHAVKAASELFMRFRWEPGADMLKALAREAEC